MVTNLYLFQAVCGNQPIHIIIYFANHYARPFGMLLHDAGDQLATFCHFGNFNYILAICLPILILGQFVKVLKVSFFDWSRG